METVWAAEIDRLGYREPKSDASSTATNPLNANGLIDIYVKDLPNGLYGYCATDDPTAPIRPLRTSTSPRTASWTTTTARASTAVP